MKEDVRISKIVLSILIVCGLFVFLFGILTIVSIDNLKQGTALTKDDIKVMEAMKMSFVPLPIMGLAVTGLSALMLGIIFYAQRKERLDEIFYQAKQHARPKSWQ